MKNQKGFTFIELLMVLIILGIVAAIVIPWLLVPKIETEAAKNLREIAMLEDVYQVKNGVFLACPACPPLGYAWTANDEFKKLGFTPVSSTQFQYQVALTTTGYKAIAKRIDDIVFSLDSQSGKVQRGYDD